MKNKNKEIHFVNSSIIVDYKNYIEFMCDILDSIVQPKEDKTIKTEPTAA